LKTKHKILLASIALQFIKTAHKAMGKPNALSCKRDGIQWQLDLDEGVDFSIFLLGAHEVGTVKAYRRLLAPGNTVIDIGANIGSHTLPLAQIVGPDGRVVAVEPTAYAFQKLTTNLMLNPDIQKRVTTLQVMLAESASISVPKALPSSWPMAGGKDVHPLMRSLEKSTDGASVTTLDAIVETLNLNEIDFIKLDVDGYEVNVLRGGMETLSRFKPRIMVELADYTLRAQGVSLADLLDIFLTFNYKLFTVDMKRALPANKTALIAMIRDGESLNALALPQDDPLRR
tara:strand:- start:1502 stop:2362 length:861 start_codon:yes stop_codon:yes gene_type:complete